MTTHPDGEPTGELTLRTLAMPADANAAWDIFGGWVMAQMDLAAGMRAAQRAKGRVVTAAVKEMSFAKPMKIGDTLSVYTTIERVGRTSMTLKVEAWAKTLPVGSGGEGHLCRLRHGGAGRQGPAEGRARGVNLLFRRDPHCSVREPVPYVRDCLSPIGSAQCTGPSRSRPRSVSA
jgi:acyl-CoA thioesterase YciA